MAAKPTNFAEETFTDPARIRNFCIIAHIDHGKSTLADRILQLSNVVDEREMRDQYLDNMDIERERGITIKAQNVRLPWVPKTGDHVGEQMVLQMIDTPGHVDFSYEVARSLDACEGAILLVDAAQGIEAQTLANLYMAIDNDLEIIPVLNKIDLPAADPEKYALEIANIIGCEPEDVLRVSGKTGEGVPELLDKVVDLIPAPSSLRSDGKENHADAPARALIFDSVYDTYRGVVTYVRMMDGKLEPNQKVLMMNTGKTLEILEIGVVSPTMKKTKGLGPGEVGYLITGVKDVRDTRVGDTVTWASKGASQPLEGFEDVKPMVYSGLFPVSQEDFPALRESLEKLQLNDASLTWEPETSVALGFGFRCGFLGLLHMEITRTRLEREFDLDLISTAPSVTYRVVAEDGTEQIVHNPSDWPSGKIPEVYEPIVNMTIIVPQEFVGSTMELCQSKRGQMKNMEYLSEDRVELRYIMPLGEIIFDFFDMLKSRTKGYASLNYEEAGEQLADLVKVDILLQGEPVDAFSAIVHRDSAQWYGNKMTKKLKELIPRQQFEVPVQAAIGSKIIARENIRALRKDVLSKCYGGDISRKRKLLEKQKAGKKRMKNIGSVTVPQEAFVAALSTDGEE
ncbi:elongation factor 4 [Corynebacterium sp. zg912]|uniref:Elongation factor 4 n=1 Tax=Corynebacterium wankanglinii TaxID=2735136 RepID=A0A7H0K9I4_9CORY|nr:MULTISPECIES: translation elongation factor 4 [Corynebacterium]MBA1837998.1 elongation factor 4 [Corynebacterium wankanglinii]MCR5929228.1 elongation factor 4 [Corynebacterium sp. zg912]QNP93950.1 elongation factor 4 [Corynebacterium wankanglinii]